MSDVLLLNDRRCHGPRRSGDKATAVGFMLRLGLHEPARTPCQIFISGATGSATGRNIHQKPLADAVRMTRAISSITYGGWSVPDALAVYDGQRDFSI